VFHDVPNWIIFILVLRFKVSVFNDIYDITLLLFLKKDVNIDIMYLIYKFHLKLKRSSLLIEGL